MRQVQKFMKENWFSFSVAFDSKFSCQCVFKCTEINFVSAIKHNCLILLLELHIRMQLSLNTFSFNFTFLLWTFFNHFTHCETYWIMWRFKTSLVTDVPSWKAIMFSEGFISLSSESKTTQKTKQKTQFWKLWSTSVVWNGEPKEKEDRWEVLSRFLSILWAFVCLCLDFSIG